MHSIFNLVIYQPIFNFFVGLYNLIPDLGVVIIIITVLIKLALYPLTKSSLKAQQSLTELQPKLEALKIKYKDDQQKLAAETMQMYKDNKVNPVSSCLPVLLQLPILLALYWVLMAIIKGNDFNLLYSFVRNPGQIQHLSLSFIDLGKSSPILAILAGSAQFWQAKMMTSKRPPQNAGNGAKDEDMAAIMNKQMLYMMPVLTIVIGWNLSAGLTLYWLVSTLLTGAQQLLMKRHKNEVVTK